jgi:hypothetical protein
MFKFGAKITKDDFFFNRKEKKLFFLVFRVAAVAVGFCLVIVLVIAGIVGSVRSLTDAPAASPQKTIPVPPEQSGEKTESIGEKPARLTLSDFMLPDETQRLLEPEVRLFRERTGQWDERTIGTYWVPPASIGLEKLRKINDKNIERLFEDVQ